MREYLLSQNEMQHYDYNAINKLHIPQSVLMERAALSVRDYISEKFLNRSNRILVVAGNGNNGGDGVAVARLLKEDGYNVELLIPYDTSEYREIICFQTLIAKNYGLKIIDELSDSHYEIIVDALFGVGLNRPISGRIAELINALNNIKAFKISVDIPSGLDCDKGCILGTAFVADATITFGFYKRGQFILDGPRVCGTIIKKNIGINEYCFLDDLPEMFTYLYDDKLKVDTGRSKDGNKGTFGKALIIAGRDNMGGACILAAKSALRSGCGMVAILTEAGNRDLIISALPEAIVHTYSDINDINKAFKACEGWADVIAIGPGIGTDEIGNKLLDMAVYQSTKPLIIDADAINIFARNDELKSWLNERIQPGITNRPVIFTPHMKEFSRLIGKNVDEIKSDRTSICRDFTDRNKCIVVLKDAYTLVCGMDNMFLNITKNDGMATAGSGDVLTGLMCSLVAQYSKKKVLPENSTASLDEFPFYAAVMSVFIHSIAGLKSSETNGRSYMIASDVIEKYSEVLI